MNNFEQCDRCGIPKYRHPYYKDCNHDFLEINNQTKLKEEKQT
jgi:hypothetical protein